MAEEFNTSTQELNRVFEKVDVPTEQDMFERSQQEVTANLKDSIQRVLGMDGILGGAAIGAIAIALESFIRNKHLAQWGDDLGTSIMDSAMEDYRAHRDHQMDMIIQEFTGNTAEMIERMARFEVMTELERMQFANDLNNATAILENQLAANLFDAQLNSELRNLREKVDMVGENPDNFAVAMQAMNGITRMNNMLQNIKSGAGAVGLGLGAIK